jgi:hypothetical protein
MRGARSGGGAAGPGCGNCGSQDLEAIRPGWIESLGTWLRSRGRWPSSQVCRRCGHVTPAGSVAYLAPAAGWWSVPARLAGVVRRRHSGRPLVTEVLLVVDPARGLRRERQEMAERFRAAPFPLYGLPASWTGPRHLGGMGSRRARGQPPLVTSLTLAHGDPAAGHGPELRVEVRSDPDDPGIGPELRHALTGAAAPWRTGRPKRRGAAPAGAPPTRPTRSGRPSRSWWTATPSRSTCWPRGGTGSPWPSWCGSPMSSPTWMGPSGSRRRGPGAAGTAADR